MTGITITMVHAEHSCEVVHKNPQSNQKRVYPGGEPAGYIIELENGFKIYHAGDTVRIPRRCCCICWASRSESNLR